MDADDCIYPDCQIKGEWLGTACEHSCPFEEMRKEIDRRERERKSGDALTPRQGDR